MQANKRIFFPLVFLIILANSYQSYISFQERKTIRLQELEIERKANQLQKADKTIAEAIVKLKKKQQALAELGEDTLELGKQIRRLEFERARYFNESIFNRKKYESLLSEIKTIHASINTAVFTDASLKEKYERKIQELKNGLEEKEKLIARKKDSVEYLENENKDLKIEIKKITSISASPIKIYALNQHGKVKQHLPLKVSIKGIRLEFYLLENRIVPAGNKSVFICINPPPRSGQQSMLIHKRVLFTGEKTKVTFDLNNEGKFRPGPYTVMVKVDDVKVTEGSFLMKEANKN